jgi:hypothetical protein
MKSTIRRRVAWLGSLCISFFLIGCGEDRFSVEVVASLDGAAPVKGQLSWVCRYNRNYSPFNMGPKVWTFLDPDPVPALYFDLPDGRSLSLQMPHPGTTNSDCEKPGDREWSANLLDRRSSPPRIMALVPDPSASVTPGVPRLSVKTRSNSFVAPSKPDVAAKDKFWQGVKTVGVVETAYISLPTSGPAQNTSSMSQLAIDVLNALPTDRPTVFEPNYVTGKPTGKVRGRYPEFLKGLPDTNAMDKYFNAPRGILSYPPSGSTVQFDPSSKPTGAAMTNIYLGLSDDVPMVKVPGVNQPIPVSPLAGVWFPDRRQLILFVWNDVADRLGAPQPP